MQADLQGGVAGRQNENADAVRLFGHHGPGALRIDIEQHVLPPIDPVIHFALQRAVPVAVYAGVFEESILAEQFIIFRFGNKVVMHIFYFIFPPSPRCHAHGEGKGRILVQKF